MSEVVTRPTPFVLTHCAEIKRHALHSYTFIIKLKWGEFLSLSNRRSRNRLKPVDIYSTHSPYSLAVDGMWECRDCPRYVACNGHVRGKRQLHLSRPDNGNGGYVFHAITWYYHCGRVVSHVSDKVWHRQRWHCVVCVAKLVIPEARDGDKEVPGEHGAHAKVEKAQGHACYNNMKCLAWTLKQQVPI